MFNSKKKKLKLSQVDNMPITTVIGSEFFVKGDVKGSSTIKIDGKITGNIFVEKGVILGEKSVVTGNIESNCIIVYGKIDGNIISKELTIKSSGVINGDITTCMLQIEIGGRYNGKLSMISEPQKLEAKKNEKS